MPTSWYQAIPPILDQIQIEKPASVLDVGVGFGKYGLLLRDVLDIPFERYHKKQWQVKIDGIEAYEQYNNPLHDFVYDHVYYGNAMEIIDQLPIYDCILFIDVLEHFSKDDGHAFIKKLLAHTKKSLLISTPLYPAEQAEYLGNHYERHISQWSPIDFIEYNFQYLRLDIGNNAAQLFHLSPGTPQPALQNRKAIPLVAHEPHRPLKISYILPHRQLTGGLKMVLEQMTQLQKRGHKVSALLRDQPGSKVLPDWYDVKIARTILVPPNKSYNHYLQDCDIAMAGWVEQLAELSHAQVPVVYWEQGHEWLFGDCNSLFRNSDLQKRLNEHYSANVHFAAASETLHTMLATRYQINPALIPNFVDRELFSPIRHSFKSHILLVGNPKLRFKGFDVALRTLQLLWQQGHRFSVTWVCQTKPNVQGANFPVNIVIQPSQIDLANIYRNADLFLFTSWYEGFGMPPLEAMASGVPVVTTDCGGIREYIQTGVNALLADPGDIRSLAAGLSFLMKNESARKMLIEHGLETARQFSQDKAITQLENLLSSIVTSQPEQHTDSTTLLPHPATIGG
ncbi:MAG: glycosyltransferase [Veillonellaceae bacterium]|nr:glycosyltransferase [Veillonellaceae bacterium]